jgi:hypothetical protein
LRGQKSRFQLFGDTVNTASRMESTGQPRQIQCSQATGDLLVAFGKKSWLVPREDKIQAKGKGEMTTFWVKPSNGTGSSVGSSSVSQPSVCEARSVGSAVVVEDDDDMEDDDDKSDAELDHRRSSYISPRKDELSTHLQRMVDWNVEILLVSLKSVVARREATNTVAPSALSMIPGLGMLSNLRNNHKNNGEGAGIVDDQEVDNGVSCPREEYAESIQLPRFDSNYSYARQVDPATVELPKTVLHQLKDYVTTIACAYKNDNPFHNFEHASHVTMSTSKILQRVVAAHDCRVFKTPEVQNTRVDKIFAELHDFSFGITSDPLTHFACVFSASEYTVYGVPLVAYMRLCQLSNVAVLPVYGAVCGYISHTPFVFLLSQYFNISDP